MTGFASKYNGRYHIQEDIVTGGRKHYKKENHDGDECIFWNATKNHWYIASCDLATCQVPCVGDQGVVYAWFGVYAIFWCPTDPNQSWYRVNSLEKIDGAIATEVGNI